MGDRHTGFPPSSSDAQRTCVASTPTAPTRLPNPTRTLDRISGIVSGAHANFSKVVYIDIYFDVVGSSALKRRNKMKIKQIKMHSFEVEPLQPPALRPPVLPAFPACVGQLRGVPQRLPLFFARVVAVDNNVPRRAYKSSVNKTP